MNNPKKTISDQARSDQIYTDGACPDERGHFGIYGGRYVAETLMPAIMELEAAFKRFSPDPEFNAAYDIYTSSQNSHIHLVPRMISIHPQPTPTASQKKSSQIGNRRCPV